MHVVPSTGKKAHRHTFAFRALFKKKKKKKTRVFKKKRDI